MRDFTGAARECVCKTEVQRASLCVFVCACSHRTLLNVLYDVLSSFNLAHAVLQSIFSRAMCLYRGFLISTDVCRLINHATWCLLLFWCSVYICRPVSKPPSLVCSSLVYVLKWMNTGLSENYQFECFCSTFLCLTVCKCASPWRYIFLMFNESSLAQPVLSPF